MTSKPALPIGATVALLLLTGCALTPRYERPALAVPASWSTTTAGEAVAADWWQRYGSSELDTLMARALDGNHDLGAARARIEQARATLRVASAQRLPLLQASATAAKLGDVHSQTGLLTASYEADLWGGKAANATAARSRFTASVDDHDAVALVLQSEVASNYFTALALRERIAIARENEAAAQQLLALVEVRNTSGATSALEVAQQRTVLIGIQAQIPLLQQSLSATLSALAVLVGAAPQQFDVTAQSLAGLAIPAIAASPPASLLEQRPDVKSVEASLRAANADVGAARAALFPSLALSAGATATGLASGNPVTVATLAASLAQVLFDGGERRAGVANSRAAFGELAENYAQTVLTAQREVHDSLTDVRIAEDRVTLLTALVAESERAYQLARIRYDSGADDLLTLLDSQRTRLDSRDSLVQAQVARYTATTSLFKALGGGWRDANAGYLARSG